MRRELPARPDLEQLKHQAKDLLKSYRRGEPEATERIRDHHPRWKSNDRLSLATAQRVIAREYGFATWTKLKAHVDSVRAEAADPLESLRDAFCRDDARWFRAVLQRHPELKRRINEPVAAFDAPLITQVQSRAMLDVLLEAGADINAKSRWWAGGFGLLDSAKPELAAYAIERGARVDVHAAARLGMLEQLRELISANPDLVRARGGDGQTPLHFAGTVEIARFLLDRSAEIDARDFDHESTPAQWMVRDRRPVARYLVERGCRTDLLMAAALGDAELARRHLDADPDCVRLRVDENCFPKSDSRSAGTIYQWTLGWHVSAHEVAKEFGHEEIYRLLMDRSPADVKLVTACWQGDTRLVKRLLKEQPNLVGGLSAADRCQVSHAARNNNLPAVKAMLAAGFPVGARGQHGGTPLHWAAFHGNAEMVEVILRYEPPLEEKDADFRSTPLGWAIHGSLKGWHRLTGDYAGAVEALLRAGAELPDRPDGSEPVRAVLERRLRSSGRRRSGS